MSASLQQWHHPCPIKVTGRRSRPAISVGCYQGPAVFLPASAQQPPQQDVPAWTAHDDEVPRAPLRRVKALSNASSLNSHSRTWDAALAYLQRPPDRVPERVWASQWIPAISATLPSAPAAALTDLLAALSELPRAYLQSLQYQHAFWAAVWHACESRLLLSPQADSPAGLEAQQRTERLIRAVRATRTLAKHGIVPPDSWLTDAVRELVTYAQHSGYLRQPGPQGDNSLGADNYSDLDRVREGDLGAEAVVRVVQLAHSAQLSLPAAAAAELAQAAGRWLPRMTRTQLSKALSALPSLLQQLPAPAAAQLQQAMLQSIAAHVLPGGHAAAAASTAANEPLARVAAAHIAAGGLHDTAAAASPSQSQPLQPQLQLDAWELAHWLHALRACASAAGSQDGPAARQSRQLVLLMLSCTDPRLLVSAGPMDLVSITSSLARMRTRLPEEWASGVLTATHPRVLQSLPPHSLSTLCWACARLGVGHAASDEWLACMLSHTHGCMASLSAPDLAQMVWGVTTLLRQQAKCDLPHQPGPLQPALSWLRHVVDATQLVARQAPAGTLASLTASTAALLSLLVRQGAAQGSTDSDSEQGQQTAQGLIVLTGEFSSWLRVMTSAFSQRLQHADGRALAHMLLAVADAAQLLSSPQQLQAVGQHIAPAASTDVDSQQQSPAAQASRTAGQPSGVSAFVAACVERLCAMADAGQCSCQDLAAASLALARLCRVMPLPEGLYQGCAARSLQLAAQRSGPAADTARHLSLLLAAVAADRVSTVGIPPAQAAGAVSPANVSQQQQAQQQPAVPQQQPPQLPSQPQQTQTTDPGAAGPADSGSGRSTAATFIEQVLRQLDTHIAAARPEALVATWVSLARLRYAPNQDTLGQVLLATHRRLHELTGAQLARVAWACGRLGVQPSPRWLDRLQLVAYKAMERGALSLQARCVLVWATARCGWPLHPEFVLSMLPRPQALAQLTLHDLSLLSWSMAKLRILPRKTWIAVYLVCTSRHMAAAWPAVAAAAAVAPATGVQRTGLHGGNAGAGLVGLLVMCAESLRRWEVDVPHWWWSGWYSVMSETVGSLDIVSCSIVWREVAASSAAGRQQTLYATHPAVGRMHHEMQAALAKRATALLSDMDARRHATVSLPACAVMLWAVASLSTPRGPDAGQPRLASGVQRMCALLFEVTQGRLGQMPPSYLVLMTAAAAKLAQRGGEPQSAQAVSATVVVSSSAAAVHAQDSEVVSKAKAAPRVPAPEVWVTEALVHIEARSATLSTDMQHMATYAASLLRRD